MARKRGEIRPATLARMSNEQLRKVGYIRIPGFTKKDGTKVKAHIRKLDPSKGGEEVSIDGKVQASAPVSVDAAKDLLFGKRSRGGNRDKTISNLSDIIPLDKYVMVGGRHIPKAFIKEALPEIAYLMREITDDPEMTLNRKDKEALVSHAWDNIGMLNRMKHRKAAENLPLDFLSDKPMTKSQKLAFARVMADSISEKEPGTSEGTASLRYNYCRWRRSLRC